MNLTVKDLQKRKLKKCYLMIQIVSKELKMRIEGNIVERKINFLYGTDTSARRTVLGIVIDEPENNRFWLDLFQNLKGRGVEEILYLVTEKSKNIDRCSKIIYNNICIVEEMNQFIDKVYMYCPHAISHKVATNLKNIFLLKNIDIFYEELKLFKETYSDLSILQIVLENKLNNIQKFYQYDVIYRKLFFPRYCVRDIQKEINKLSTKESLCVNIDDIIHDLLPLVKSFEKGTSHSKSEWNMILKHIYIENLGKLEQYL